jgi:pimeloyl-ACP methyl ester carboxylesterase
MTTFLLIPGAGGDAAYWNHLVPRLERLGHTAVPVDLPAQDETAGWVEYTDVALAALGDADPRSTVVVGQSLGAYVAPLVAERVPVRLLVLVNPMIPAPGETAGEWWEATGHGAARAEAGLGPFQPPADFFHDVPPDVVAEAMAGEERYPSDRSFAEPWPATAWPDVPTVVLQGLDDRFFPPAFTRRVARDRLAVEPVEMPGGHLLALSRPDDLARRLVALADAPPSALRAG